MTAQITEPLAFLDREYPGYRDAVTKVDTARAWHHLERPHVVAQPTLMEHLRPHWVIFGEAERQRDGRKIMDQIARLLLAIPGNISGRLPIGSAGRARNGAFRRTKILTDLERLVR